MKRLQSIKIIKQYLVHFLSSWKMVLPILLFLLSGIQAIAQPVFQPVVKVRFANPQYDCPTQSYCLDVEFQSNTLGQQLYGMNVRFFYDDSILEYQSTGDFEVGYGSPFPPQITTDDPACGALYGFSGPLEWFNGTVKLISSSPIYISTTGWTRLFSICFHVDGPYALGVTDFCPSIVWDLELNPGAGGFQNGDDGVVITIVDPSNQQLSAPSTENVEQFNWQYDSSGNPYGYPQSTVCISKICGYAVPVSNWALFLGIGLMLITSLFIWRRRMN